MSEKEPPQNRTAPKEQDRLKELRDMVREDIDRRSAILFRSFAGNFINAASVG